MRSWTLALVSCLAAPLHAQDIAPRSLGAPNAEFPRPFTKVASVRELRDGRVLVVDAQDRLVHRIDFRAGAADRARAARTRAG